MIRGVNATENAEEKNLQRRQGKSPVRLRYKDDTTMNLERMEVSFDAERDFPEENRRTCAAWAEGRFFTQCDRSHTTPDWDRILALGIPGLLADAEARHAANPTPFTESAVLACRAFRDFALRFARVCERESRADLDRAHQDWIIREAEGSGA